ncbi:MAG: LytR/AlgR family response regulator transcription factor [Lentihominibacter sp.]
MEKKLYIKEGDSRTVLDMAEIIYMEKYKSKILVYTLQRQHRVYRSFISLENELDRRFMRPHESYIINMEFVRHIGGQEIILKTGTVLRFGVKCARRAKKAFDKYVAENSVRFIS